MNVVGGEAGRSAMERAAALRREAADSEAQAKRWEQGAFGERRTARALDGESRNGWTVFHDLSIPGRTANIDHVVVAPGGVFVIDSKHWTTAANEGDGTLWTGRVPHRKEIRALTEIVAQVRRSLEPRRILVRGVLSLTEATPVNPLLRAGEIEAVAVHDLIAHLRSQPQTLSPADIEAIAPVLARAFPARSGSLRPAGGASRPQATRSSTGHPPPATLPAPPRSHRPGRRGRRPSLPGRLLVAAITLVGGLVTLGFIAGFAQAMKHQILRGAPTTTTVAAVPLVVHWSCPTPAQRWTATIAWPAGVPAPYDWMVQTAPALGGTWAAATTGFGDRPVRLTGVEPGQTERVRAGSLIPLEVSGQALTSGQITAPTGC